MTSSYKHSQRGVTLLELLVAIVLFSMVGVAATFFLNQTFSSKNRLEQRNESLIYLQTGLSIFGNDFTQVLDRSYKDALSSSAYEPLIGNGKQQRLLAQFVRAGDIVKEQKARLVRYRVESGTFIREVNLQIDGYQEDNWQTFDLITEVSEVSLSFYKNGVWNDQWNMNQSNRQKGFPKAVKLSFKHEKFGHVSKIVQLPQLGIDA